MDTIGTTVTLGGISAALVLPDELAALNINAAMATAPESAHGTRTAVAACALLACWPDKLRWPGTARPSLRWQDPIQTGHAAYRTLREAGIERRAVWEAAAVAFHLVASAITTEEELSEAMGNSEAPEAPPPG